MPPSCQISCSVTYVVTCTLLRYDTISILLRFDDFSPSLFAEGIGFGEILWIYYVPKLSYDVDKICTFVISTVDTC